MRPEASEEPLARAPFISFWETTRACDLACKHCRACAVTERDPNELDTEDGKRLLRQLREMGVPLVVLTGGDPAKRPDLVELVAYGAALGLRMALTPSATPLLTVRLLAQLKQAGLSRLALSLDGLERTHDAFRGVSGAAALTATLLEEARALGLATQINTTIGRHNVHELAALGTLVEKLQPVLWSLFFVVPTGRASAQQMLDADESERVLAWLAEQLGRVSFDIKTTAAPHFRRLLLSQKSRARRIVGMSAEDGIGRMPRGINDGQGVLFVSHHGEILPSGFLPIVCGNVRTDDLAEVYRKHALFTALRDPERLSGKCGACPFKRVCGGSRARAYAVSGDPLAEDPVCAYVPRGYARKPQLKLAGGL